MASKITIPYEKEVENTCRKLKKNIAQRRQSARESRFLVGENPEKREQKKGIGYVIQLTEQPQKSKREDWGKAGDCGYIKLSKRNKKDLVALSGGDSRSKNVKGPSGDHRSKNSSKKETSCQTSTTTKYVKITPEIIHQNEIMLSKLKRNEELLQQIKKHKEMIHLLKTKIRHPESADADEKKQNEESQPKSKHEFKQVQFEVKSREKLVHKKVEPVPNSKPNVPKARNIKNNVLPDIKEYPEPVDALSLHSLMCRLMKAAPIGMDKLKAVRNMYGTTVKKPSWSTKHERPSSPRYATKQDRTYMPLKVITPNVANKVFGSQKVPTLKPVINFKPIKKLDTDKSLKLRQSFPFVC